MAEGSVKTSTINPEDLRQERLRREREYYLSDVGYMDFARDSGAAPDACFQPHGRYCQEIITWNGVPDPGCPDVMIYKSKLILWPRGSFKSQFITIAYAAWMIAKDPNIRILICSEVSRQAQKFVSEVMKIIDSQWFKDRFGVHKGKQWKEGSGVFYSALRTRQGIKDPTLAAAGVGEVQTGAHWDLVIMDDVCSQENTKTPEAIESLWGWFGEVQSQLDPGTRLLMIGTLHHYADIYCKIIKDENIAKTFEISKHAWADPIVDPLGDEPTELFFPSRLTRAFVADRKLKQVPRLYACFYENRPQTGESQLFKPEYFRVIEDKDIPSAVWTYILTDFAFIGEDKKNQRSDRTAFWVVSLDCNRVAYVRDFVVGRWKPSDSCRIVCDLWSLYQQIDCKAVSVEKVTHKELLLSLFEEIRRQTFVRPQFVEIEGRNQEIKDIRIEAAEPRFRRGDIYFARSMHENYAMKWRPMFEEMTEWPFSTHDDIPDAISDIDKKDKDGKYYLPHPPSNWSPHYVKRFEPPMLNGGFNPKHAMDARDRIKQTGQGHDLWGDKSSNPANERSSSQWAPRGNPSQGHQPGSQDVFGKS
jgi:hypothetical protein